MRHSMMEQIQATAKMEDNISFNWNKVLSCVRNWGSFFQANKSTQGADPGFFLGGGAPLRNGVTSTNKPH